MVGGASKRLPDFEDLNPESILLAGSFESSSSVFLFTEGTAVFFAGVGQELAGFVEDPTDPLFPPPQPASNFESGAKTANAVMSVINIFFISITVLFVPRIHRKAVVCGKQLRFICIVYG